MAEGRDVAQYLSRGPLRGVSVHYTVERATDRWEDGEVVRCLAEDRIGGSIDPRTVRRGDDRDGYYGASHAKAAFGSFWPGTSPNCLVIGVEVAGRAKDGPTEAQRRSMVALVGGAQGSVPEGPSPSPTATSRTSSHAPAGRPE